MGAGGVSEAVVGRLRPDMGRPPFLPFRRLVSALVWLGMALNERMWALSSFPFRVSMTLDWGWFVGKARRYSSGIRPAQWFAGEFAVCDWVTGCSQFDYPMGLPVCCVHNVNRGFNGGKKKGIDVGEFSAVGRCPSGWI